MELNSDAIIEKKAYRLEYADDGRKILNQYIFMETIGKGSYAKVKVCLNTQDNRKYAVKIINKNILKKKKKGYTRDKDGNMMFVYMLEDALNEIKILKILNAEGGHKNVVKLYEIIDDENGKIYLILEYCVNGSIVEYDDRTGIFSISKYYKGKEYSEDDLKKISKDIFEGLEFGKVIIKNNSPL